MTPNPHETEETGAEPQESVERPSSIDYLISDYGNYLGIAGMAFDQDHTVSLVVEEMPLLIEYTGEGTGLVFQSIVGSLDSDPDLRLMLNLNVANHSSYRAGMGVVTIDPDTGDMVWQDRLNTENVTVEMFDEAVKRSAECVRAWMDMATTFTSPATVNEEESRVEDSEPLIRV